MWIQIPAATGGAFHSSLSRTCCARPQEVDHFKFLERTLGPLGYRGLWEPKPDSPCLYLQDNNGSDGCALLWRADRFTLLHEHRATLHVWRIPSNQVQSNRVGDRLTNTDLPLKLWHSKHCNFGMTVLLKLPLDSI